MGNSYTKLSNVYNYSINNPDKKENETHIYQNGKYRGGLMKHKTDTLQGLLRHVFDSNKPENTLVLERFRDRDGNLTRSVFPRTYAQIRRDAENFGKGILDLHLCSWKQEFRDFKIRVMGIYAPNSYHYLVMDLACIMFNVVSVPIYDTLGAEATTFAFTNTGMESLCLSHSHLKSIVDLKFKGDVPLLKNLILLDDDKYSVEDFYHAKKAGLNLLRFSDVMEKGGKVERDSWETVTPSDIYTFSYTSGTTGTPKGAMLSQGNLAQTIQTIIPELEFGPSDRHLNYLPMAHIMERFSTLCLMYAGATIAIFGGDVKKLKDDLQIFKPTIFVSVPRLYNKFFDAIQLKINEVQGSLKGKLVNSAVETKLENLRTQGKLTHVIYDQLVFKKMKAILGGEVRLMITGSAPLNKDVADMLKICMCCPLAEAYGQTEGTGAEFGMFLEDTESGHVGGVMPHNEFKLVDVPDMNYTSKDVNPQTGISEPRGEIWVRGGGVIPGYYKNEGKNKDTFTEDGWLKSGDIGKIEQPYNRLVIIDRKKNIFKLSQGEYIAPEKLEGNYKTCTPLITDIFIYGDSFKSSLLSIVTIEKENIQKLASFLKYGKEADSERVLEDPDFEQKVLEMFSEKAKEVKFNRLEIPKGIVFNVVPFADLGLLTTSFKPKRNDIKTHFINDLNKRYEHFV